MAVRVRSPRIWSDFQGRPVAARPEGRRYRAGKFVRRHRVGIAVAVSLVLSLLGGLATTAWQARAKTLEAQKAEAVKTFLISIFQGADPAQASGREITLRQVLDDGAGRDRDEVGTGGAEADHHDARGHGERFAVGSGATVVVVVALAGGATDSVARSNVP